MVLLYYSYSGKQLHKFFASSAAEEILRFECLCFLNAIVQKCAIKQSQCRASSISLLNINFVYLHTHTM